MKCCPRGLVPFLAGLVVSPLAMLLTLAGCEVISTPSTIMNDQPIDDYNAALAKPMAPATAEAERRGLEDWKALLSHLTVENVRDRAGRVYAEETFFNDTLKPLRSAAEVEAYLIETAELLESGTVEYRDTVRADDGTWYVRWEMIYRGKKLAGGEPIRTIGMSQLRFDADGRVVLHQDFWDASRGIFEHIPVVGAQVRWIKKRL
jgi:hypothetical protein